MIVVLSGSLQADALVAMVASCRWFGRKSLSDGRSLTVVPLLWGRAVLTVWGAGGGPAEDWYEFDSPDQALDSMDFWDPRDEPEGPDGWSRRAAV